MDLISRQAAINTVMNIRRKCDTNDIDEYRDILVECFAELPTAEPKRGRWEMKPDPYEFFDEIPVCSECGCITKWRAKYPYCPTCGAKMEGEDE